MRHSVVGFRSRMVAASADTRPIGSLRGPVSCVGSRRNPWGQGAVAPDRRRAVIAGIPEEVDIGCH
jgi:hypothetical protein